MNERINQLHGLLKEKSHHQYRKDDLGVSILDVETSSRAFVIRKALSLKKAFEQMPIFIQEGELIVGGRTVYKLPEYVLPKEIEDGNPNIEDEGYDNVFNIHHNLGQDERGYGRPDGDPPHYFRIVRDGFPSYKQRVQRKLNDSTDKTEREYYEAVLIGYEGFEILVERYARLAEEKAKDQEGNRSAELMRVAKVCRNIIAGKPHDMWEALQLIYFVHLSCWTEDSYLVPVGRLDQILFEAYTNDVKETGQATDEDIKELIECFYIKLNYEIDKTHGKSGKFESDTGQTVVLGGLDPDTGEDASNELTLLCLDICEELHLTDPKVHMRLHPKTKENVWDKAVHLASLGMGFPTFDNDEAIFKALRNVGPGYYSERDILDYGISGCWEVIIPGRTSFRQCCNFDMLQVLEWTLNRGRFFRDVQRTSVGPFEDPVQWGLDLGDLQEFTSFSELLTAYKKQLRFAVMMNANHIIGSKMTHQPFLSSFIDDCIDRGKDINEGGVRYNETDMQACSMANAADSLYIIKKFVYDEKRFSLLEFFSIIRQDYQNHEDLRLEILNKYPHYGNDNDEVDSIAKEIIECFADEYNRYTNSANGPFRARISGATSTVYFSTVLGPSADGRHQGDLLAHNASPQAGLAKNGPTAIVNSLTKIDTSKFGGGEILTLKFTPRAVQGKTGEEGLKHLIKTYFKLGGLQLQTNVVDSAVLLDAQEHPEAHKDLIVRVWGFSTYFVSLPKSYQDQVINEVELGVE
jgi:pyruvate-formate lyase